MSPRNAATLHGALRLLLVEDDAIAGAGIRRELRQAGFAVDWVHERRGAETALDSQRYSVVLLDLGQPRKHGFPVLEALHRRRKAIPVVLISARQPFDLVALAARIHDALRRRAERAERDSANMMLPFSWG